MGHYLDMRRGPSIGKWGLIIVLIITGFIGYRLYQLYDTSVLVPEKKAQKSKVYVPKKWKKMVAPNSVCPNRGPSPAEQEELMRCLINYARAKSGIKTRLVASSSLYGAAKSKAARIIACQDFSHTPCGDKFAKGFKESGYGSPLGGWSVGENLAWGEKSKGNARTILIGWMESPEHRDNLFAKQWKEQAVYFKKTNLDRYYVSLWVSQFGRR